MSDVMEIDLVKRESAKLILAVAGQTGEGKTYTALMLALGLANMQPAKVGMIDTENRASLNSDIYESLGLPVDPRFLIGNLRPPHSPARYILAMQQMAAKGVDVIVIDSGSHEHEGTGGLEEIANAPKANGEPRKIADWIGAKREHRKYMNVLLALPCHVIVCLRAREKFDFKNPQNPVSRGIQPIAEKNFMFEMTASFMMEDKGRLHHEIKLPECLRHILGNPGYFTPDHGQKLATWMGGIDPFERAKNALSLAASQGTEALRAAWMKLEKPSKRLAAFKDTLKDLAAHADAELATAGVHQGAPDRDDKQPSDNDGLAEQDLSWEAEK